MFLWCAMTTRTVNSCQMLCVTNYLKIKRLTRGVSSSCSQVCGVVGLGEVWLCNCAWGCGLPTPAHLGAPGEEAVALPGISWQPSGMHACICKCVWRLCLYTSNIPLSKQANPQIKKSYTGYKFGLIIQSMTHGFKFSLVGKNMVGKGEKKSESTLFSCLMRKIIPYHSRAYD